MKITVKPVRMTDLLEQSTTVKVEAEKILFQKGLYSLLVKFGEVHCSGSYYLDLMLKQDIDLSLVNPDLSEADFFRLGGEVSGLLTPHSIHYRNTRVKFVPNRPPESLYWGFEFGEWNIDLWLVPEAYHLDSIDYLNSIANSLDQEKRLAILDIKQDAMEQGLYGRQFSSRELYRGVIQDGVRDLEGLLKVISTGEGQTNR